MNLHQAIDAFLDQHKARSQHTARTYACGLGHFSRYLKEQGITAESDPNAISRTTILGFLPWLASNTPTSMRSRSLYGVSVREFLRYLALAGLLDISLGDFAQLSEQMAKATAFKKKPIETKLPAEDVIKAMLEAAEQEPESDNKRVMLTHLRNKAIVLALHSSGMRVGELVGLRLADLDDKDHGAWIKGKGDKTRFVRFSSQAWQAIQGYLEAREAHNGEPVFSRHDKGAGGKIMPLTTISVEDVIRKLAEQAGVLERFHLTPHSFRHYFATTFLQHTGDLALTQDALGHADPATTRIYAKTTKQQQVKAHQEIFG